MFPPGGTVFPRANVDSVHERKSYRGVGGTQGKQRTQLQIDLELSPEQTTTILSGLVVFCSTATVRTP